MPFGLCNAPATFQRCMMSIFSDMIEEIMEVFMDDFSVFGESFEECLINRKGKCVHEVEQEEILNACHASAYGGHYGGQRTALKILESGFYWPALSKDAHQFVTKCDRCQRTGNISKRHEMPQSGILEVELFDVWGMDFMGPFPSSRGNKYILVLCGICE
ncbi:hypothetical protein K1719_039580 [Acacia pycnantha]|nr:hypothetical protein K1719_039580 [Acacia pycnantha]